MKKTQVMFVSLLAVTLFASGIVFSQSNPRIQNQGLGQALRGANRNVLQGVNLAPTARYTILGSEFTDSSPGAASHRGDSVAFMRTDNNSAIYSSPSIHLPPGASVVSLKAVAAIDLRCAGASVAVSLRRKSIEGGPGSPVGTVTVTTSSRGLSEFLLSTHVDEQAIQPPSQLNSLSEYYYVEAETSLGRGASRDCLQSVELTLFRLMNVSVGYVAE